MLSLRDDNEVRDWGGGEAWGQRHGPLTAAWEYDSNNAKWQHLLLLNRVPGALYSLSHLIFPSTDF